MSETIIGRRTFLKGLPVLALSGSALFGGREGLASTQDYDWIEYARRLVEVIDKDDRRFCERFNSGLSWEYKQYQKHYEYAFQTIRPENHHEKCIAFACAHLGLGDARRAFSTSDEYARRRRGDFPLFPGHPLFSTIMKFHGHPQTYGLMMYREQWDSFIFDLVEEVPESRRLLWKIYRRELGWHGFKSKMFFDLLKPEYKESLSPKDMQVFQHVFHRSYGSSLHYFFYSSAITKTDLLMCEIQGDGVKF